MTQAIDGNWQGSALCSQVDPEIWFPDRGQSYLAPKRICLRCPVRQECLDASVEQNERFGVWGGFSETERRRLPKGYRIGSPLNDRRLMR